ncbi:hypothetical protein [Maridesulfovibrio sp.]|uniref:hypothetical protein n=1 Tax=Maridesulfovibrio sp. TaxID=2795000 RepID=UPI0039EEC4F7
MDQISFFFWVSLLFSETSAVYKHQMNSRPIFISAYLMLLLIFTLTQPAAAKDHGFGLNWQFSVDFPQAGIAGELTGYIEHLHGTKFKFSGKYLNKKGPVKSGPIAVNSIFELGDGILKLNRFTLAISKAEIDIPQLGLYSPDLTVSGNGAINPVSGAAHFNELHIKAGSLPELHTRLEYSPEKNGNCRLKIKNPLPLLDRIIALNFPAFENWDKDGQFSLDVALRNIQNSAEAELKLGFTSLSAASPDGMTLLDSLDGTINASFPVANNQLNLNIDINAGEALYDRFYVNLTNYPLQMEVQSILPDKTDSLKFNGLVNWKEMGELKVKALLNDLFNVPSFSGKAEYYTANLAAPFKTFAIDPFSLEGLDGSGTFSLRCAFNGTKQRTVLTGDMRFENCTVSKDEAAFSGINAYLPFMLSLNDKFLPQADITLPYSPSGMISFDEIKAGKLTIENFAFPISVSSNSIEFGIIPVIGIDGGSLHFSDLKMRHPFNDDFALNGKIIARDIDLLPLSPESLPIHGQLSGDLKFWLLKDHLSTTGKLFGKVYGGDMTIDEIFAENPFEDSRQYGADFKFRHLDLEPLSQALDIGRITGRMDLDLNELVIAYNQPASFHLLAKTTPGSGKSGDISLKAVNTLSVIGTGSGLTGAGVGMFSQFFKEFGYAGLGLECTLDDDIFKIRGLIREDGIEYIIKRPPLFGINVINSNPENLISFSDMLKRLKRVIGN